VKIRVHLWLNLHRLQHIAAADSDRCRLASAFCLEPFLESIVRALVKFLLLPLLVAPTLLFADGLTDVRATLQKLQSDQPLRARVEIKARHSGGESSKQKQSDSVSSVIVESGGDGLKLSWSPDQIKASRKAAWAETANPDAPKSDIATLKALEAGHALNLLDAADPLRRGLERAVLLEDKSDTRKGKPARLLVIRVDLALDEEERKALKSSEAIEKLWLDSDGIPIAMDRNIEAKFSKFLIGFKIHEHETREFQRAAGRLVTTSSTKESSGSGLGHSDESHTTIAVTLLSD
jgi:hypothetical protein